MIEPTPTVSGVPAVACEKPDCWMCQTTFADTFAAWICPHCGSHLSKSNVCLNLCGLSHPDAKRFNEMLAKASLDSSQQTRPTQ